MHVPKLHRPAEREPHCDPQDLPGRLAAAQRGSPVVSPSHGASVLVVDGDDAARGRLAAMLERLGYEVECADSAAAARAHLARNPFDVLLCDFGMPGESGLQLIAEVTQH